MHYFPRILLFLFFLGLTVVPRVTFSQTRFIPESQAWENLNWWEQATVSYEAGSQTLSGRIGHSALQAIWFTGTAGGVIGSEIAERLGLYEGMGDPTMGEREIMAGVGMAGDILGATGMRVLGVLPLTRAAGSLTAPEAAYVGMQRGIKAVKSLTRSPEGGNSLAQYLLESGELAFKNDPLGGTAWEMSVKHGDVEVGKFPYWADSPQPGMMELGNMKVEPAYQGGGIYSKAMSDVFARHPHITATKSIIQNKPTVNYMRWPQRLGFDMSRVFRHSPLGRSRAGWGFRENFVTHWRTVNIRDVPTTQFDVLSFKPGPQAFLPPRVGVPGGFAQGAAAVGGGLSDNCHGLACKPPK